MQPIATEPDDEIDVPTRVYRRRKTTPIVQARAEDAIPANQCERCGYPGPHATPAECITALRDRLARYE